MPAILAALAAAPGKLISGLLAGAAGLGRILTRRERHWRHLYQAMHLEVVQLRLEIQSLRAECQSLRAETDRLRDELAHTLVELARTIRELQGASDLVTGEQSQSAALLERCSELEAEVERLRSIILAHGIDPDASPNIAPATAGQ